MKIRQQLEQTLSRFNELEAMMSYQAILSGDSGKMANIMREHGGQVGIESKEGVGTVVTLQFPQKHRRVRMLKS
jgi:hypothetical protein